MVAFLYSRFMNGSQFTASVDSGSGRGAMTTPMVSRLTVLAMSTLLEIPLVLWLEAMLEMLMLG
jgi:hypothetical protein